MAVSVVDPVAPAIEVVRRVLFNPFELKKWLVLGFCAFLATLGGGNGPSGNWNFPSSDPGFPDDFDGGWLEANMGWVLGLVAAGALVVLAIVGVTMWLSSRGRFMLLDGVLNNRAAVKEPWGRFRELGNSLFLCRVVLAGILLPALGGLIGTMAFLTWDDLQSENFSTFSITVLVTGFLVLLLILVVYGVLQLVISDFLAPVMYLRNARVTAVLAEVRSLTTGRPGTFALYVLFRCVILVGVAFVAIVVTVCTCCLTALPYVGTVILLPLLVFLQAYPLCFLSQFGTGYERFENVGSPVDEIVQAFE